MQFLAWGGPRLTRQIVAGFPPGSHADLYARLVGQALSERLGKQFVVENRTGVGGTLAAETVARAAPDGYTLLLTNPADALAPALYDNLRFDYLRDIAPVASLGRGMAVSCSEPVVSGEVRSGIHRLRKKQPGQDQLGIGRYR